MARKAKQQVSFKVSLTLPSGMNVTQAQEWVRNAIYSYNEHAEDGPKVEPDSIRVKLEARHVYY